MVGRRGVLLHWSCVITLLLCGELVHRASAEKDKYVTFGNSTDAETYPVAGLHDIHSWARIIVFPVSAAIIGAWMLAHMLHYFGGCLSRTCHWVPHSAVVMLFGALLGFILRAALGEEHPIMTREGFGHIDSCILNLLLLPPIIFESGWSLRTKDFASQILHILIFAVVGTVISMFVVASICIFAHKQISDEPYSWRLALCYGVLISAVDPVASLATYAALEVEPLLNIIVFGESTINDAVAIAIFEVLNNDKIFTMTDQWGLVFVCCWNILWLLFGSILLGTAIGILITLCLRCAKFRLEPNSGVLVTYASAFLTFAFADGYCELSGIIAVLFEGIFLGIYGRPHLTDEGTLLCSWFLKQGAGIADTLVFMFAGFFVVFVTVNDLYVSGVVMFACIVGRALAVYPLGVVVNCLKRVHGKAHKLPKQNWHLLSCGHLTAMFWAGLRGGIALVLCLELGEWADEAGEGTRQMARNATFVLVCTFMLFFGGTTTSMLKLLKIPVGQETSRDQLFSTAASWEHRLLDFLHNRIFVPCLVGDAKREEATEEWKKDIDVYAMIAQGLATAPDARWAKEETPLMSETDTDYDYDGEDE